VKSPNPTTERINSKSPQPPPHDDQTGLPGLPTWPRVYILVVGSFILWVVLLRVLTRLFA
jgi:hypothetical protein